MELWIRSQDKESLLMIKKVFYHCTCNEMKSLGEHYIGNKELVGDKDYTLLGKYQTKERALEVLDEIQKILKPQMILSKVGKPIAETCDGTVYVNPDEYEIKELSTYVYEMPED